MDHKLIKIGEHKILLDRLACDEAGYPWQVIISTFVDTEHREDDWRKFRSSRQAREFIARFSDVEAELFLITAKAKKQPVIN